MQKPINIENQPGLNLESFLDIVHSFSKSLTHTVTEEDVYWKITQELPEKLNLIDCVIYEISDDKKTMVQVAAYGAKNKQALSIENRLTLEMGQGLAGKAAQTGQSILVEDVTVAEDYVEDLITAGSEIEVPIKIKDEVIAVISSEHTQKGFYSSFHIKLFEIIAAITVGVLIKIRENNESKKVKEKLEKVLEKKSADLSIAIDMLSKQYVDLREHSEKQKKLLQEIHHRVNNNLQIISSLIKLYLNNSSYHESENLKAVHNRIQAMALTHQNVYRSFENNLIDLNNYIKDLLIQLKNINPTIYFSFDYKTDVKYLSLDTLVPLGLFITELITIWLLKAEEKQIKQIKFIVQIKQVENKVGYHFFISDNLKLPLFEKWSIKDEASINAVLLSALIDQLEGEHKVISKEKNSFELKFNTID